MKILCPLDFSSSSVSALKYGLELFNSSDKVEVSLIHCFDLASSSSVSTKLDEILRDKAEKDMQLLIENVKKDYPNAEFSFEIYKGDPKVIIPSYAKRRDFNFVMIGTKGMTELKDMVIGSLTETLFENSETPIIAVPNGVDIKAPSNILVALDDKNIENQGVFDPIKLLVEKTKTKLHLCHVCAIGETDYDHDPLVDQELKGIEFEYTCLKEEGSLVDILANHANTVDAEMVALIHRHRTWWQRLFSRSQSKEKLFNIIRPLLILNGDARDSK